MNPLQAATIQELIDELLSRSTFRGVVAWQRGSFKGIDSQAWSWGGRNIPLDVWQQLAAKIKPGDGEIEHGGSS